MDTQKRRYVPLESPASTPPPPPPTSTEPIENTADYEWLDSVNLDWLPLSRI